MRKCPHCRALNSEKAAFCWRCYKPLYTPDFEGYMSLRKRIRKKMRDILKYSDIRELLREKIRKMAEREAKEEEEISDEWVT